jgi:tetratricopeptide (TPR) repeat protein
MAVALTSGCSQGPDQLRARAVELQDAGRFEASLEPLGQLLELQPKEREANYLYGRALVRTGRFSEAVWPLGEAVRSPEFAVAAGMLLAEAQFQTQNLADAIRTVDQVLEVAPDHLAAILLRTQAQIGLRQGEPALEGAERGLELEPDHLDLALLRTQALLVLKRFDEVEEALAELQARFEAEDPSGARAARLCVTQAVFAAEKGELETAAGLHRDCAERFPSDPLAVQNVVEFFTTTGEFEEVTQVLSRAISESPEHTPFRVMLAGLLLHTGEAEEAERLLLEATREFANVDSWTALVDHYVAVEDYAAAASAAEQVLALVPNPPARYVFAYGDMLLLRGDLAGARRVAATLAPPYSDILRGRILLEEGRARAALEALQAGVVRWPDNPMAHYLTGQAAEQLGNFDLAISEYREAVRGGPAETQAALRLAQILIAQGEPQEAVKPLTHHIQGHPQDPEGYVLWIRLSGRLGRPPGAALDRLARLPGQEGRAVAEYAALVRDREGPAAAVQAIEERGLDLTDPIYADALEALVEHLASAGDAERALVLCASAVAAHPDSARLHDLHAFALEAAKRPTGEVRRALDRALASEPEHAGALARLSRLEAAEGNVESALRNYERAAAADPDSARVAYEMVALLEQSGRAAQAEQRARLALRAHPLEVRLATLLARILVARGDLDEALPMARHAVRFGGGAEALDALGWVQLERGSLEASLAALRGALEEQDSPSTRYRLARALAASGDPEAARRELRQALAAGSFPEREQALAELERLSGLGGEGDSSAL